MGAFRAMGTDVTVHAPLLEQAQEAALTARVASLFADNERRFSRFDPDSELSRLNRARGRVLASPPLFDVLRRAACYRDLTDGIFDCTVGAALARAGYDRSFEPGDLDRPLRPAGGEPPRGGLQLDAARREVQRAEGTLIDLGGIVKGLTVDLAACELPDCAAVDAGGDVVLRGEGPDGEGWWVDVEDPFDPHGTVLSLRVRDAAVATSAPNRRRWRAGESLMHHLIDPRTGAPARSDLAQVTVVERSAERAEVLAKAAFILGASQGAALLERARVIGAVLVRADRSHVVLGELEVTRA